MQVLSACWMAMYTSAMRKEQCENVQNHVNTRAVSGFNDGKTSQAPCDIMRNAEPMRRHTATPWRLLSP